MLFSALLVVCGTAVYATSAAAQDPPDSRPTHITQVAAVTSGSITGTVTDQRGRPLDGVIVSALGASMGFAVTDRSGKYTLRSLMPGPYLLRAHLHGYLPARNAMVNVRPAARTSSSFTLRREGLADEPRLLAAGTTGTEERAAPSTENGRDESETAWRLRHLKRSILKDATTMVAQAAEEDEWFLTESFELIGRAMGSSARAAGSIFTDPNFQGQVNLLTTGAFDRPVQLFELDRTHSVAFFALGAPVGGHGDWSVRAALNQGDLSSWILAGSYVTRAPARHRYQFGMSYGLHRYEGGNAPALAAVAEAARNVGAVYAYDEWSISKRFSLGYGANYAHYDYLPQPAHFSPRVNATISATDRTRIRAVASRQIMAPGAEEFLPPSRAPVLPPQRTFAPFTRDGFRHEDLFHYELGVEHVFDGSTIGVRAFHQRIDDQLVTIFGFRTPDAPPDDLGHYFVASSGDVMIQGWGVRMTHAFTSHVRSTIDYSQSAANWRAGEPTADRWRLARRLPSALRGDHELIHDLTTSIETTVPQTATRVYFLVKMNSAFIRGDGTDSRPGLDGRFDLEVSQALPFMNFLRSEWQMLVGVRNLFRESLVESSLYDELLVARPPKRLIGGLTVKF